jgi:hypothetical protein
VKELSQFLGNELETLDNSVEEKKEHLLQLRSESVSAGMKAKDDFVRFLSSMD